MKIRCSITLISALLFSLCLVMSVPAALGNASTWRELTLKLPYGAIWNFLAPLGFADLGIVAIGLIVLWTGYRKRERWAWFVMLIVLLCFSFPSSVLPSYRWSYLLGFLGVLHEGGWHCLTILPTPSKSVGIGCMTVLTTIGPLKFLVMSIALLLPIKAFFWKHVPPQLGGRTKTAAPWKKHTWVWVLALLLVLALAVALTVRSLIASSQNGAAQNWHGHCSPPGRHERPRRGAWPRLASGQRRILKLSSTWSSFLGLLRRRRPNRPWIGSGHCPAGLPLPWFGRRATRPFPARDHFASSRKNPTTFSSI